MLAETQAGLAWVALAQGELAAAQDWVAQILAILPTQSHVGLDETFLIYLTCYQVLTVSADPRAEQILLTGIAILERYAERI